MDYWNSDEYFSFLSHTDRLTIMAVFLPSDQITALHTRHKRTLFCRELLLVSLSCPHSPLVSRSHMWHGGHGRLLRALLRRGIVWTSSSELSEVALELSASASEFAVGPSGSWGVGRIHSSSLMRCPWCSRYRRRKWTRRHEFKSWTRLIAFSHSTITLGEGMNPNILPPAMGK